MAKIIRDEFVNTSSGIVGAITIDGRGDRRAVAVRPGESVWLSEDEQIETANAPRADSDNPLVNGMFELRTHGAEVKNRRPLRPDPEAQVEVEVVVPEETGAAPIPVGEPEVGSRPLEEEVATPEAVPASGRGRRRVPSSQT
jgi:hypothetical protein